MRKLFFLLVAIAGLLSSCKFVRSSVMLRTPKGYNFNKLSDSLATQNYRISPTNAIQFRVFSNDGFKLIDLTNSSTTARNDIDETVDNEGNLKLPLLGKVYVQGLTLREAELMLEEKYSEYYVKPYVQLKITNKRVIVFPGSGGTAKVIPITNNNTTVFEALALAGGITDDGKAYRVKLIRNNKAKPEVYLMDLSKIDGLAAGNTIVLASDIIYVEPRNQFGRKVISELTPYVSLLTTAILVYTLFKK